MPQKSLTDLYVDIIRFSEHNNIELIMAHPTKVQLTFIIDAILLCILLEEHLE